jgi:iron complex transport system substrate-binding protein
MQAPHPPYFYPFIWVLLLVCGACSISQLQANCQLPMLTTSPQTVVALNQTSIENILRLDLQHHLLATAFLDDEIPVDLASKLDGIPEIAKLWPSREQILALKPELIYAGFPSAFAKSTLGTPRWWQAHNIEVLINPYSCQKTNKPLHWQDAWQDLDQLAQIFHVSHKAETLKQQAQALLPDITTSHKPKVLLLDVYSQQAQVGACCGGADLMIRLAGGINVGANLEGRWSSLSWEAIAQQNPDIIVLSTYQRTSTSALEVKLNQHPLLSKINAVKNQRIINIPFTATLASPRIIEGISDLNAMVKAWQ